VIRRLPRHSYVDGVQPGDEPQELTVLQRLTRLCISRRWTVIAIWAAVLVGGFAAAPVLFSNLSTEAGVVDDSESVRASERLWRHAPSGTAAYAVVDGLAVDDPNLRSAVTSAADRLAALPGVKSVVTPWSGQGAVGSADARGVATDGRAVAMGVEFKPTETGWLAVEPATELLRGIDAPEVMVGGEALLDLEMEEQAAADLAQAELFSLPVVLVLLLVVFGGVVAAGLPVLVALLGTAATLGLLAAVSAMADVSVYAVNIVTMLGLGLAVDYALLVVSRFREERVATSDLHVALLRTFATAGRTVAFSGMTVAASLAGLLAFPDDFLRSMGLAGLAVVLLAMAATLTLLPALLSLVGHRIRPARASGGGRLVRRLAGALHGRRAVAVVAVVVPLLALAALPFLQVRYAEPDERSLPASSESRRIQEMLRERFASPASSDPLTVVTETRLSRDDLAGYVKTFEGLEGVRAVTPRSTGAELTAIDVLPKGPDQGPNARALVEEIRALDLPVSAMVTGDAARLTDYEHALSSRLPVAGGIVMAATFVLLFLFTGSVVVPLKAIVMNLLSLGASFGALVWVFQEGNLGWLVGTEALGSLSITTPVLVFAMAFGLSMDYEIFLLGRIAEEWRRTRDNRLAVSRGLEGTARIVTAAALLMTVVFAGFVAGGFSPVKQVGFGLALAIVVDATIVRMLLVPAVMSLMGRANWWAPAPLRRLHRRIGLHEAPSAPAERRPAGLAVAQ
jgi:RND superfamily putative drug exporter